jgi:hypothetical protein
MSNIYATPCRQAASKWLGLPGKISAKPGSAASRRDINEDGKATAQNVRRLTQVEPYVPVSPSIAVEIFEKHPNIQTF